MTDHARDREVNAALAFLDGYELESFCAAKGDVYPSEKNQEIRREAVGIVIDGFKHGDRIRLGRRKFRKQCVARCIAKFAGSINVYLLIFRLMLEIIPLLWKWWKARSRDRG